MTMYVTSFVGESVVYGIAMYDPNITDPSILYILVKQLFSASTIMMCLDAANPKGMEHCRDGINLFIMAAKKWRNRYSGVCLVTQFSGDGGIVGRIPYIGQSVLWYVIFRMPKASDAINSATSSTDSTHAEYAKCFADTRYMCRECRSRDTTCGYKVSRIFCSLSDKT